MNDSDISHIELSSIVEALLFAAEAPMRPDAILEIFQHEDFAAYKLNPVLLEEVMQELKQKYERPEFVFELRQVDGGYQLYTKRLYYPYVRHAAVVKNQKRLSRTALETLSIIAYRQPITKAEMEFIRGVNCDYTVRSLLDKNLIVIVGRSEAVGRPLLYGTSSYFMEYFGINDIKDLPKLEEIKVNEAEFQAQFKLFSKEGKQETEGEKIEGEFKLNINSEEE